MGTGCLSRCFDCEIRPGVGQEWDRYLSYARRPTALGFVLIQGCGTINRTKEYEWYTQDVDDNDHMALLQQVILI
jgi:hypothetical protein